MLRKVKVTIFNAVEYITLLLNRSQDLQLQVDVNKSRIDILEAQCRELMSAVIRQHPQIKLKHKDDHVDLSQYRPTVK